MALSRPKPFARKRFNETWTFGRRVTREPPVYLYNVSYPSSQEGLSGPTA